MINAEEGTPHDENILEAAEFDYVIVGAGPSAMGLLLGLIEPFVENKEKRISIPFSIAIIERGPEDNHHGEDAQQNNLCRWFEISHDHSTPLVSLFETSLIETGRLVDIPVGQGIGGGSNVNAGLCMPPPMEDLAEWPEPWKTNLPASVRHLQEKLAANKYLWDAATGEEISSQVTSSSREVPCLAKKLSPSKSCHFQRVNYFQALLQPLLRNKDIPNVHWFCNTEAQRLLFQGNQIIGVEVTMKKKSDGTFFRSLFAREEVILCAGAIETPALLLASGVGPKTDSKSTLIVEGIGKGLRDHVILPRVLVGSPPCLSTTINGIHGMQSFQVGGDKFLLMTSTSAPEIALHFFTRILYQYWCWFFCPKSGSFDWVWGLLEGLLKLLVLYTPLYHILKYGLTTMNLALVNPQSTGSVTLKAKQTSPLSTRSPGRRLNFDIQFDLAYLRHHHDANAFWRGWVASPVLCQPWWWELYPGGPFRFLYSFANTRTKGGSSSVAPTWFTAFAKDTSLPFFHWCGTCAMKQREDFPNDDNWVVDASFRVRSLEALRVCDASVFPNNLSVPPALTCTAMGHLLASQILKDNQR